MLKSNSYSSRPIRLTIITRLRFSSSENFRREVSDYKCHRRIYDRAPWLLTIVKLCLSTFQPRVFYSLVISRIIFLDFYRSEFRQCQWWTAIGDVHVNYFSTFISVDRILCSRSIHFGSLRRIVIFMLPYLESRHISIGLKIRRIKVISKKDIRYIRHLSDRKNVWSQLRTKVSHLRDRARNVPLGNFHRENCTLRVLQECGASRVSNLSNWTPRRAVRFRVSFHLQIKTSNARAETKG